MQKRYLIISIVFIITAIVAGLGYLLPQSSKEASAGKIPIRILFDNTGGKVVFDHKVHAEKFDIACIECHHEMPTVGTKEEKEASVIACASCHGVDYSPEYIAGHEKLFTNPFQCATCHHMEYDSTEWGHDLHSEDMGMDCTTCHHDTDIEPEPQNCADCHSTGYAPIDDPMPSLKNAVHTRCLDCHQDFYDEGLYGCQSCHTDISSREKLAANPDFTLNPDQVACISCHEGVDANELIIGRMETFHESCMSCHEKEDKGPYKADQCAQCHM